MTNWGKRRGLSPLPAFGRSKFDAETRRAFDRLQQAARTAEREAVALADVPLLAVPVVEDVALFRRRTTPSSALLGRMYSAKVTPAQSKRGFKRVALGGSFVVRVTAKKPGHSVSGGALTSKSASKGAITGRSVSKSEVFLSGERAVHAPHQAEQT